MSPTPLAGPPPEPGSSSPREPGAAGRVLRVHVVPRRGVLDPQGRAVASALRSLGFEGVADVRVGKVIDVTLVAGVSRDAALEAGHSMCRRLLANEVVEDFEVELLG